MSKVTDMTVDELERLIEQKVLELLGDPDAGLGLKPEFKKEFNRRMKKQGKTISQQEVVERFG